MAYLLIPILCFVLLGGLTWVLMGPLAIAEVRKGKVDDLDLILSVLMTAEGIEPYLIMKVPRRVTSVKMTFSDSRVRLEMPLVTRHQQSHRERYLAILRDLKLNAQVSNQDSDHDTLEWEIEGTPAETSAIIKDAFVRLFEVDPGRALEFRAFAHAWDQKVIDQALQGPRSGDDELPTAATQGRQESSSDETRAGCMKLVAGVLLLPLPFMAAYLKFGYIAASAVLVAIIVCREAYLRWKGSKRGSRFAGALKTVVLLLTGTTIFVHDPFYLQLIPTAVLSILAVAEVLAVSFDLPQLSAFDPKEPGSPRPARMLLSFAIIATCVGAVAMNEYLRTNLTLDAWVWFFAFFRIELILGFLVTSIPLIYYMVQHIPRTDGDSDSP